MKVILPAVRPNLRVCKLLTTSKYLWIGLCMLIGIPSIALTADSEDAILVLDASGSMWGQIDGEAKITIAKRVLDGLLLELPAERRLGLFAYGHNRKGDCSDIEELAPVGADRATIKTAISNLNPRGKTPMTDAVRMAAEKLRYTEERATVILVSDGIETCAPDPCGMATALEQAGIDFTAHVIGFDVREENEQAQLRCIAENTGGQFISANNAEDLGKALQSTVVEAPKAATENLYLRATELKGGPLIDKGLNWAVTPSAGSAAAVLSESDVGSLSTMLPAGTYNIVVERPADGLKGSANMVEVRPHGSKTVTIALEFSLQASITVAPEASGVAGSEIAVAFSGPERQGDFISISEPDSKPGSYKSYRYVKSGNPVKLRLPVATGEYQIRYVLGRPYRVLAAVTHEVTAADATLKAAATAAAGDTILVDFTGPPPGAGDFITIARQDAAERAYMSYAYTRHGSPAKIKMPLEPGDYELRFVQANSKVLARQPISVVAVVSSVSAPTTAGIGESIKVAFTGPQESGNYITVTTPDAAEKSYLDYAYTRHGSPADLRMPLAPGQYEIRFVQSGSKVIARQAITINDVDSSLSAQSSAIAGDTIAVTFRGPAAGSGDYIAVAQPGSKPSKYIGYRYTKLGSPVQLRMPLDAGDYELRFVIGNKKVIATEPINITAATATLQAVSSAAANSTITVAFTGPPEGSGDYISIAAVGARPSAHLKYARAKNGSPVQLRTPSQAGKYEIRYVQGNKKILAQQPLQVIAAP